MCDNKIGQNNDHKSADKFIYNIGWLSYHETVRHKISIVNVYTRTKTKYYNL